MIARGLYTGAVNYLVDNPSVALGVYVMKASIDDGLVDLICRTIAVDTMNKPVFMRNPLRDGSFCLDGE